MESVVLIFCLQLLVLYRTTAGKLCSCPRLKVLIDCDDSNSLRPDWDPSVCIVKRLSSLELRCSLVNQDYRVKKVIYSFHRIKKDMTLIDYTSCNDGSGKCKVKKIKTSILLLTYDMPFICTAAVELIDGSFTKLYSSSAVTLEAYSQPVHNPATPVPKRSYTYKPGTDYNPDHFGCKYTHDGTNIDMIPRSSPPTIPVWYFRKTESDSWKEVTGDTHPNVQVVGTNIQPKAEFHEGQLVITKTNENNVGMYRCDLIYSTGLNATILKRLGLADMQYTVSEHTLTISSMGYFRDGFIEIASMPALPEYYRLGEIINISYPIVNDDLSIPTITWYQGVEFKPPVDIDFSEDKYKLIDARLTLQLKYDYSECKKYFYWNLNYPELKINWDFNVHIGYPKIKYYPRDFINSRQCFAKYTGDKRGGNIYHNKEYMAVEVDNKNRKQYMCRADRYWSLTKGTSVDDAEIESIDIVKHGISVRAGGDSIAFNYLDLYKQPHYSPPSDDTTCVYYQYSLNNKHGTEDYVRIRMVETITAYYTAEDESTGKCDVQNLRVLSCDCTDYDCTFVIDENLSSKYVPDVGFVYLNTAMVKPLWRNDDTNTCGVVQRTNFSIKELLGVERLIEGTITLTLYAGNYVSDPYECFTAC